MLAWMLPQQSLANDFATEVKITDVDLKANYYAVSADIFYHLSDNAVEALQNGVPLFWELKIRLNQQRDLLWDKTLVSFNIRYRLQYHALLNMYRVRNEGNNEVYNFSTLPAALEMMSSLRNFRIINQEKILSTKRYNIAIKIDFDRNALPLPLRPVAYLNRAWYLSSDWTLWTLKK